MAAETAATVGSANVLVNKERWDGFWRYIFERQRIYHRRFVLKQPAPWTDDPVLQKYSFTNAYRELDRGTIHCINYVLGAPNFHLTYPEILSRIVCYRFFNRTEVWDECMEPILNNPLRVYNATTMALVEERIRQYAASGRPPFTGAFMVASYPMFPGKDKIEKVCGFIRDVFVNSQQYYADLIACKNPKEAHKFIMSWRGVGPFNAYEFMSDMYYVDGMLPWTEDDWANPGPGAQRGLRLIYPERRDYEQVIYELRDGQGAAFDKLGLDWMSVALKDERTAIGGDFEVTRWLTMRNIEHNLCEYSKYARGRARNKFKQRTF